MIYEGKAITVKALESGIVELKFDLKGESVNKFNRLTLNELRQAVDTIKADASIKGVIVSSGKDVFIVGADITEFVENFKLPDAELVAGNLEANKIFSDFEDLNVPTVAAINGIVSGAQLYRVPLLMLISDRGTFGERDPWQTEGGGVTEDLLRAFDLLTGAEKDIKESAQPRYFLEMLLLRWIHLRKLLPIEDVIAGLNRGVGGSSAQARPATTSR